MSILKMRAYLKKIASESFIYGISQTAQKFLGIFLLPVYTRLFSVEAFGVLDVIQVSLIVSTIVLTCGFDSAVFRFGGEAKTLLEKRDVVSRMLRLQLLLGVGGVILIFFWAKPLSLLLFQSSDYVFTIQVAFLSLPLVLGNALLFRVLRLLFKAKTYAILSIAGLILNIGLILLLLYGFDKNITSIFIAKVIADGVLFCLLCTACRRLLTVFPQSGSVKEYVKFGLPLMPAALSQWALTYFNRYILLLLASIGSVGLYTVGYKISSVMMLFTGAFQMAWSPFAFSIQDKPEAKQVYASIFQYYIFVAFTIGGAITLFSEDIVKLVSSEKYYSSYYIVGSLVGSFILLGVFTIFTVGAAIKKQTFLITLSFLFGAVINVLCALLFIPVSGIMGAAISTLFGIFGACGMLFLVSQRIYAVSYDILYAMIAFSGFLVLMLGINNGLISSLTGKITAGMVVTAIHFLVFQSRKGKLATLDRKSVSASGPPTHPQGPGF